MLLSIHLKEVVLFAHAYLHVKSGVRGKSNGTDSTPSEEDEKSRCLALLRLGISEVFLNIILTELEKATAEKKVELENELYEFVRIHDVLGKHAYTFKPGNGLRRGTIRSTACETSDKLDSNSFKLYQERLPLLATSSISWLLQVVPEMWKSNSSTGRAASQNHSQLSCTYASVDHSKLISFALNTCVHQLMTFPCMDKDDPLKSLIYGEFKSLGPQLLKLVWWLKSRENSQTDQRKKEVKAKKGVDDTKEHIHLTLFCLKKLMAVTLNSSEFSSLIDDLVSVSEIEQAQRDDLSSFCQTDGVDDQNPRSKILFIKIMTLLLLELLELSFFREVEVEASHLHFNCTALLASLSITLRPEIAKHVQV